jgi:hypothetical protein
MAYVTDLDFPQIPSDVACAAAGVDLTTFKNWASRKPGVPFLDKLEKKKVGTRWFFNLSIRRVMQLAIAAALTRHGFTPSDGAKFAAYFTDAGDLKRLPGHLFDRDYTVLAVRSEPEPTCEVINVSGKAWWPLLVAPGAVGTIVNLNEIERRVRAEIGVSAITSKGNPMP